MFRHYFQCHYCKLRTVQSWLWKTAAVHWKCSGRTLVCFVQNLSLFTCVKSSFNVELKFSKKTCYSTLSQSFSHLKKKKIPFSETEGFWTKGKLSEESFFFIFFVNFSHGSLLERWVCYVSIHLELVALFLCKQIVLGLVPSVILIQNVLALFCPPQKN